MPEIAFSFTCQLSSPPYETRSLCPVRLLKTVRLLETLEYMLLLTMCFAWSLLLFLNRVN